MTIDAINLDAKPDKPYITHDEKLDILDRLDKGEIDYHTAMALMKGAE